MSQSGSMNSPRKMLLYATEAIWIVCDIGLSGEKPSDALTKAVCFELFYEVNHQNEN